MVAYLAHHEAIAKAAVDTVETDESRAFQTAIAKAMTAMREAIGGEYYWKTDL